MTRSSLFAAALAAGCASDRDADEPPIACVRDALSPAERERHHELLVEVKALARGSSETEDGVEVRLPRTADAFRTVAEWISLERRCCPFLSFALAWPAGARAPTLRLGGRPGVKEFLVRELGVPPESS
jgi:hypothetical protein